MRGRAIAQAVSHWLPTAAARGSIPGQVMWDLWWTKWHWGRFFSGYFGFPCQFSVHRLLHTLSSIIRGWYNRPNIGRRTKWTQSHPIPKRNYFKWEAGNSGKICCISKRQDHMYDACASGLRTIKFMQRFWHRCTFDLCLYAYNILSCSKTYRVDVT
jgi:hypothetical protein